MRYVAHHGFRYFALYRSIVGVVVVMVLRAGGAGQGFTFAELPRVALVQEDFGMPNYTINTSEDSVAIEITGVEGRQAELLGAFGECQQGQCSCPTNEYEKIDAMDVHPARDRIAITLRAKPGATFDPAEIAACLDYTVGKGKA